MLKALVLESGGTRMAYAIFDLAILGREVGDRCTALAEERTGIPAQNIVWACTHTHTGPHTGDWFPYEGSVDPTNRDWLKTLPERFAACVQQADAAKVPARMSRVRAYCNSVGANRRYRFKGGREINTWLLSGEEDEVQCVGAGPIDPEIGVLAFDAEAGGLIAVLFNYALHANANFGPVFSGDYPAVVASRIREVYGPHVSCLFAPGACGDVNPMRPWREVGDTVAEAILVKLRQRRPVGGPMALAVERRDLTVPYRDLRKQEDERITASQWPKESQELFRQNLEIMRRRGETETRTQLAAWRIGEVGFVGLPGELFVEWGMHLKQRSPFAWTYPVELCGDYVGYLVTRQAWEAGGYESLISTVAPVDVAGVEKMIASGLEMLARLR